MISVLNYMIIKEEFSETPNPPIGGINPFFNKPDKNVMFRFDNKLMNPFNKDRHDNINEFNKDFGVKFKNK